MGSKPRTPRPRGEPVDAVSAISTCGYKSLHEECGVEVRPLTILAGANSSGKSSALQPLLLLKQTLEASYDPGPLRLDGPNVTFTSSEQLLSASLGRPRGSRFSIDMAMRRAGQLSLVFKAEPGQGFVIEEMTHSANGETVRLRPGMSQNEILSVIPPYVRSAQETLSKHVAEPVEWAVGRMKCFLEVHLRTAAREESDRSFRRAASFSPCGPFEAAIRGTIHVPGLRGNPKRTYQKTAVGPVFLGLFQDYTASIVFHWQSNHDPRLQQLGDDLGKLGLTWKVRAKPVDETQLELLVGRLARAAVGGAKDLVSIADVGFGVSQALPVVVALLTASPGQLVYVEQPEIHLHPRAQIQLAELLAAAAKKGVRVVVETHSALLLLAMQTLVAEGKLSPDLVKLHWFERNKDGATKVTSRDVDKAGAFENWPEDFGDVELKAESRYLDAAEQARGK